MCILKGKHFDLMCLENKKHLLGVLIINMKKQNLLEFLHEHYTSEDLQTQERVKKNIQEKKINKEKKTVVW